jgi:DNA-binding NtrC family response regulator
MHVDAVLERSGPTTTGPVPATPYRLLVVDDQREILDAVRLLFTGPEFTITTVGSPASALAQVKSMAFDASLIDLNYEQGRTTGEQGLELVTAIRAAVPSLPIIVMTAWGSSDVALAAIRRGARDIVEKPWDDDRLIALMRTQAELGRALARVSELESENDRLRARQPDATAPPSTKLFEVEGHLVRQAMERHQGNVSRAARTLGLSRSALYRRLERHKIPHNREEHAAG